MLTRTKVYANLPPGFELKVKDFQKINLKTSKGIFPSPQGKRSGSLWQESWSMQQKRIKAVLAGCKGPRTCGMPYLSIICQIYQSSFLEAFRNLKVVTKAYSSGRPCGNTSLARGGEKKAKVSGLAVKNRNSKTFCMSQQCFPKVSYSSYKICCIWQPAEKWTWACAL